MNKKPQSPESRHVAMVRKLVGKTIVDVRYLTPQETSVLGWSKRPIVIIFNDGSFLYPSMDDEGNDAGALFTSIKGLEIIGTM